MQLLTAGAWEPDKAIARAAIHQAEAQIDQTQTEIERALVRAPVAAACCRSTCGRANIVGASPAQSLVVLGDIGSLHVRVDIDEADIPRIPAGYARPCLSARHRARKCPCGSSAWSRS